MKKRQPTWHAWHRFRTKNSFNRFVTYIWTYKAIVNQQQNIIFQFAFVPLYLFVCKMQSNM